jgi:alpha-L-arabinofuranosidase
MKHPNLFLLSAALLASGAQAAEITIHTDKPGKPVSPTLYGVFFEDINRAGDGGLYAEMIQNRSFEDSTEPVAWTLMETGGAKGSISLDRSLPLNANNPTGLKFEIVSAAGSGSRVAVVNEGFKGLPYPSKIPNEKETKAWVAKFNEAVRNSKAGINIVAGKEYDLSLYARAQAGTPAPSLTVSLERQDGSVLAQQSLGPIASQWKPCALRLVAKASDSNARLVISGNKPGTAFLDMVSLFPRETYKGRQNGLRPDLARMIEAIHPKLLRFPGGSFSEGHRLVDAWRWKETLGDVATRPGSWNIWGYRSTNGLGFHEYLQLAEDMGAEPLYVAHVGMAEKDFVPLNQLEPWIQDTLDAIEYANGPVASKWGALRAKNGHPKPFGLKYVEIGNENGMGYSWGGGTRADYLPRYKAFFERIKRVHPEITTIANIHTEPDVPANMVDEHYYESADWFFKAATQYDSYDRTKPKVYVGEYAAQKGAGHGNLKEALAEAAFLTGLERNSDVVAMSSFAPLFTNPPWEKWKPDAIVFDNTTCYGTPSYHVQAMFASNQPDTQIPVELTQTSPGAETTLFAVAGIAKQSGALIVKVVNRSASAESAVIHMPGLRAALNQGTCLELAGSGPEEENSFQSPNKIAPKTASLPALKEGLSHVFPPYSVSVLRWTR